MEITKEQYDILNKINTSPTNKKESTCNSYEDLSCEDKIYIFPTCKIKKLDLRKWLKFKGIKQVHKPELATACVVPSDLIQGGYWSDKIVASISAVIPFGNYNYYGGNNTYYSRSIDMKITRYNLESFINHVHMDNKKWYDQRDDEFIKAVELYDIEYTAGIKSAKLDNTHVDILSRGVKLINVSDIQQVLHDWEIKHDIRDSTAEFEWESLKSLITSEMFDLAFVMIKKMNVEPILSELLSCYYCRNVDKDFKRKLYRDIFSRNPKLIKIIPGPNDYGINGSYHKEERVDQMISECLTEGMILDRSKFDWIIE